MNDKLIDELRKYGKLCNDEFGEYTQIICNLNPYTSYMTDDFKKEFELEVANLIQYFKSNTEIIKTKVTREYETEKLNWLEK